MFERIDAQPRNRSHTSTLAARHFAHVRSLSSKKSYIRKSSRETSYLYDRPRTKDDGLRTRKGTNTHAREPQPLRPGACERVSVSLLEGSVVRGRVFPKRAYRGVGVAAKGPSLSGGPLPWHYLDLQEPVRRLGLRAIFRPQLPLRRQPGGLLGRPWTRNSARS